MKRLVLTCFAAMAVAGPAFADAKGDVAAARDALDRGDPRAAMAQVDQAIKSNTLKGRDLASAHALRCSVLAMTGNAEPAKVDAAKALELNPKSSEAYACRGAIAAAQQDMASALAAYDQAAKLDPKDPDVAVDRAALLAVGGKPAEGIAAMDKVIAANPKAAPAKRAKWYTDRARMHAAMRDEAKALKDLDVAIAASPKGSAALADRYFLRARLHIDERRFEPALADLNNALTLMVQAQPIRRAVLYAMRGSVYATLDRNAEAIADLDGAIGLVPEGRPDLLASWYATRGRVKADAADVTGALADFNRSLELNPNEASVLSARGNLELRQGAVDRAITDLEAAAKLEPNDTVTLSRLAWASVEKGDYATAVERGTRVVELRKNHPLALWERGVFRFLDGRFKEAAGDFGKVTAAAPSNAYAAMFAHIARSRSGDTGAELLAKQSDSINKAAWPWPAVQLFLGQTDPNAVVAAANADPARAASRLAEANFYIGEWYLLQNQKQSAREMLQRSAASGDRTLVETAAAKADLKRLGR